MKLKPWTIVVAHGLKREIGINGELPWKLSEDLKFFKEITMGQNIVMGRKTFLSIGKALPGRKNIVLTREPQAYKDLESEDSKTSLRFMSEDEFRSNFSNLKAFIIGGSSIYEHFINECSEFFITKVDMKVSDADSFFPSYDQLALEGEVIKEHEKDQKNEASIKVWHLKHPAILT